MTNSMTVKVNLLQAFLIWIYLTKLSFGIRSKASKVRRYFVTQLTSSGLGLRDMLSVMTIVNMARGKSSGGFGHVGASMHSATSAKALLVVIILILIIPAVALVFTGGTTNSTGVYTNTTVANNARNGIAQFSQFIGIAMILGIVGVIISIV